MAAFSGRLGKDWLGVWARVRLHGEQRMVDVYAAIGERQQLPVHMSKTFFFMQQL